MPDEVVWNVPPLPTATAAVRALRAARRARAAGLRATDADHAAVAQICERLDGIPLAIELASARLRIMTVEQIAEHLEDRFRLLVSTDRQADARQRSLLATLTWSYDLLDDGSATCSGGCPAAWTGSRSMPRSPCRAATRLAVVDRLERLVAAGLVTFADRAAIGRYRMLETVRDFAAGQREPGDDTAAGLAHADATTPPSPPTSPGCGPRRGRTGSHLGDREIGNLRAGMGWAFANDHARLGMATAHDLWHYFWTQASGSNENVRWGRLALDLIDDDEDDVALVAAGTVIEAYNLGDVPALQLAADRVRRALGTVRAPARRGRAARRARRRRRWTPTRALPRRASTRRGRPRRCGPESLAILNNLIELSWLAGDLATAPPCSSGCTTRSPPSPGRPQMARKVEAGVAASAGEWADVLRCTADLPVTDKAADRPVPCCAAKPSARSAATTKRSPSPAHPHINDYWADIQRVNARRRRDRARPW